MLSNVSVSVPTEDVIAIAPSAHNCQTIAPPTPGCDAEDDGDWTPEYSLYRARTVAMLKKYFRLSIELGRLPSLVGREFFRARVTSCRMHTFEDVVIFAHDMEAAVAKLSAASRLVLARMVFEEYTFEEAARLLGCSRDSVRRAYFGALDHLSEVLLRSGLLHPFPVHAEYFFLSRGQKAQIPAKSLQA